MSGPNYAVIEIDATKCTTPFDCKKCLAGCPQSVFAVAAMKVEKGRETNPKDPGVYTLYAPHRDKCTGCDICIEVCPVDALTITFPAQAAA
jgi:NAD-dependent dihydropyrimidine dehydrogenase PreA subunit